MQLYRGKDGQVKLQRLCGAPTTIKVKGLRWHEMYMHLGSSNNRHNTAFLGTFRSTCFISILFSRRFLVNIVVKCVSSLPTSNSILNINWTESTKKLSILRDMYRLTLNYLAEYTGKPALLCMNTVLYQFN